MDSRDLLSLSLEQNLSTILAKDVQIAETRDKLNCCFLNERTEFLLPGLPAEDNEENAAIIKPQLGGCVAYCHYASIGVVPRGP